MCRNLTSQAHLDLQKMSGLWYTQFYNIDREGTCPQQWWKVTDHDFKIRYVSKAATINVFRDWVVSGQEENGQLFTMPVIKKIPMQVVSTDYERYAIIYRCSDEYTHDLMGQEQVLVLTRNNSYPFVNQFE